MCFCILFWFSWKFWLKIWPVKMYVSSSNYILGLRLLFPLSLIGCSCSFLSVCLYFALLVCCVSSCLSIPDVINYLIQSHKFQLIPDTWIWYLMINGRIAPFFVKWKFFPVSTSYSWMLTYLQLSKFLNGISNIWKIFLTLGIPPS